MDIKIGLNNKENSCLLVFKPHTKRILKYKSQLKYEHSKDLSSGWSAIIIFYTEKEVAVCFYVWCMFGQKVIPVDTLFMTVIEKQSNKQINWYISEKNNLFKISYLKLHSIRGVSDQYTSIWNCSWIYCWVLWP